MIILTASVGEGGDNRVPDVRAVQAALNRSGIVPGPVKLPETGLCNSATIALITQFQQKHLTPMIATGLIVPGDATHKTLEALDRAPVVPAALSAEMSGAAWWHANQAKFPDNSAIADLAPGFRTKVENFLAALAKANATVRVAATRRNPVRGALMHWSFMLAKGKVKAKAVPAIPGCTIDWVHADEKASQKAAQEMVDLFQIAFQPSLTSLHFSGQAIDMRITWTGTLKITGADGIEVEIGTPLNGASNTDLHAVGKGYGVIKLLKDKPHWSINGH